MVLVREGIFKNYDLFKVTILEIIQFLWTEVSESKNNVNYKYYWWRFNFKKQLIRVLKERSTNDYLILNFLKLA